MNSKDILDNIIFLFPGLLYDKEVNGADLISHLSYLLTERNDSEDK